MLITHDLDLAGELAHKTVVLYLGQILEEINGENILENPKHPYSKALAGSFPSMDTTRDLGGIRGDAFYRFVHRHKKGENDHKHIESDKFHMENHIHTSGCIFRTRCTQALEECKGNIEIIEKGDRKIRCIRGGIAKLATFNNISKKYKKVTALAPLDLELYSGELFCIVGETGSGKTTLAMLASKGLKPDSGTFKFNSDDTKGKFQSEITGIIYQSPMESVSHRFNVFDIVSEPLKIFGHKKEFIKEKVLKALKRAQLPTNIDFLARYPHELNMGAVQRVCIARAIVNDPLFLIADEPTSALDPSVQAKVLKMLLDLQRELGLTMLFITHNIGLAKKIADRAGVMLSGEMVEMGPAKNIFNSPRHPYTRLLLDENPEENHFINNVTKKEKICPFAERCSLVEEICFEKMAVRIERNGGFIRCHNYNKKKHKQYFLREGTSKIFD